jgi:hypothetical protein
MTTRTTVDSSIDDDDDDERQIVNRRRRRTTDRQSSTTMTNDLDNNDRPQRTAGEVVHPPSGWQVRVPLFFQHLVLTGIGTSNDDDDDRAHPTR